MDRALSQISTLRQKVDDLESERLATLEYKANREVPGISFQRLLDPYIEDHLPGDYASSKLEKIFWNINYPPEDARIDGRALKAEELNEQLYAGPEIISVYDAESTWAIPVINTTVGGVLQAIHEFYKSYVEDEDKKDTGIGGGVRFHDSSLHKFESHPEKVMCDIGYTAKIGHNPSSKYEKCRVTNSPGVLYTSSRFQHHVSGLNNRISDAVLRLKKVHREKSPKKQYDKYEKFRVFDIFDHEFDKTTKLGNVFWNIMDPPEKSRLRSDDRTSLNLDEQVFAGPIIVKIQVEDNSVNNTWAVPIIDTTARGVLRAIHDHYKSYKKDKDICGEIWFEGLSYYQRYIWTTRYKARTYANLSSTYEKLRVSNNYPEGKDTSEKLDDICWYITDPPKKACYSDDRRRLNLKEQVFTGPEIVLLYDRRRDRKWALPVIDTTIGGVLRVVHDHYKAYEKDKVTKKKFENSLNNDGDMGNLIVWEQLEPYDGAWTLGLGS